MLGVAFMLNPNCSWSNGLGLETGAGKELNAVDGLPKALGVEDALNVPVTNVLFAVEPNIHMNVLGVGLNAWEIGWED